MSFTKISPVDITPGSTSSWVSTDLSAYIDANATGVVCQITISSNSRRAMIRHGDSTDAYIPENRADTQQWAVCGVNSSSEIDVYVSGSGVEVILLGYFDAKASFFTNAVDVTPGTAASYENVDISGSTGTDTAIAAAIFFDSEGSTTTKWARKDAVGSPDDYKESHKGVIWQIVGCDSEVFECYISSGSPTVDVYLVGYWTDGIVYHDNAIDVSLGSTGSYADLTTLGSGATAGLYYIVTNNNGNIDFALRPDGGLLDDYFGAEEAAFAIAPSTDQVVEGKIETTNCDFYELGYFQSGSLSPNADEMRYGFSGVASKGFGMAGFA